MDGRTLVKISQNISLTRANQLIPGLYEAFDIADLGTVLRRRMFLAQTGQESVGWSAVTEFASGSEYEWRSDLGNTHQGDGVRFKGRGFIQLTGRNNYGYFSKWCFKRKLVPTDRYFLDHPEEVASPRFAWLSAAFYWLGNHNHGYDYLNKAADAADVYGATLMINGGTNGLETRQWYYNKLKSLGNELMTPVREDDPNWSDVMTKTQFEAFLKKEGYAKKSDVRDIVDNRVSAAIIGTSNKSLKADKPKVYRSAAESPTRRISDLEKRASKIEKAASAATATA